MSKKGDTMKAFVRHNYLFLLPALFIFSGCFDTDFHFKTAVDSDGSVNRQTRIEGRAANLFKSPDGPGWKSKASESKGASAIIPDKRYVIEASGHFQPGQAISSDYQFNIEEHIKSWGEKELNRAKLAGFEAPFEDRIFSKNQLKISRVKGFFSDTVIYEETFQNAGIISLLLTDIKEELREQSKSRGEVLEESELDILAHLRLEEDILPEFRFKSEIKMPGKLISSNGKKISKNRAVWEFSLKDFQKDYSIYKIEAVSRTLRLAGIIIWSVIAGLGCLFVLFALAGVLKLKTGKKRKGRLA